MKKGKWKKRKYVTKREREEKEEKACNKRGKGVGGKKNDI